MRAPTILFVTCLGFAACGGGTGSNSGTASSVTGRTSGAPTAHTSGTPTARTSGTRDQGGPATSADPLVDAPRLDPLPALAEVVVRQADAADLTTAVRVLVPHPTTADGVTLALRWENGQHEPLGKAHRRAGMTLDVHRVLGGLRVRLHGPDGDLDLGAEPGGGPSFPQTLATTTAIARLDAAGVRDARGAEVASWKTPPKALFAAPGKYTLRLAGELTLEAAGAAAADGGSEVVPFETGDIELEVRAASSTELPLGALEARAASHVASRFGLRAPPEPAKATVEDVAGNRVVRFALRDAPGGSSRYDLDFVEVVMAPSGEARSMSSRNVFTCVAAGTAIDTPAGPRAIESLAVGDTVWGYDLDTRRRVATRVTAALAGRGERVLEVAPGLRVTPRHPVFAGGRFVPAGELEAGAELLSTRLAPFVLAVSPVPSSPGTVVELSVDWPHTYFAGGYLVHNKAASTQEGMSAVRDDWASIDFRPSSAKR